MAAENHTCLSNDELSDLIENVINAYNQGVINKRGDARTDDDRTWSVHQSIYFASTIVSTIGNHFSTEGSHYTDNFCTGALHGKTP